VCLVAVLLSASVTGLPAGSPDGATISILTRNQFLGADLTPIAQADDVPSFLAATRAALERIAVNNFPERAQALAREIADRQPDVVALQEVFDFRLNGQHGPPPFVDHLAETLDALADLGASYVVVASVRNFDVTLPADLDGDGAPESFVSATDRDVILAREDLVDDGAVTPVPLSGVCARPSGDGGPGCNYVTVATIPTPLGGLPFERGYVAVDVVIGGRTFRVVNTHLEVENLDPSNPLSPLIQSAQAAELKTVMDAVTPAAIALVVAGDLNSTPFDPLFPDPENGPFVRPFQQLALGVDLFGQPTAGGPYQDVWELRAGEPIGNTCCEPEHLFSPVSTLFERKDLVFSRQVPSSVKANVVGADVGDKTPSGLWPSDHAGVFVRLWF
jgi:hypothetical protein